MVSTPRYKSTSSGSNPGHSDRSSPRCSSSLFGLVERMGTWENLGKANFDNPVVALARVMDSPTIYSRTSKTEMTAEAERGYSMCP